LYLNGGQLQKIKKREQDCEAAARVRARRRIQAKGQYQSKAHIGRRIAPDQSYKPKKHKKLQPFKLWVLGSIPGRLKNQSLLLIYGQVSITVQRP